MRVVWQVPTLVGVSGNTSADQGRLLPAHQLRPDGRQWRQSRLRV